MERIGGNGKRNGKQARRAGQSANGGNDDNRAFDAVENALGLFAVGRERRQTAREEAEARKRDEAERAKRDALKAVDVIAFNTASERAFVGFLTEFVSTERVTVLDAIRESAFELNVSTETAKRYLLKHTARRASFAIESGVVVLRQRA